MQQRRSRNLLAISLVSLVALAACGDDETTESTSAAVETTAAVTETTAATDTTTATEETSAPDTTGGEAGGALAGICPETVIIQTDWMPEAEHGFLYNLVGDGYEMDADLAYVTGPLLDSTGADMGVDIQVRSGGVPQQFSPVSQLLYNDEDILLGFVYTDEAIQFSGTEYPTVAVMSGFEKNPQMIMWDPATYPDVTGVADLGTAGATVRYFGGAAYMDYLTTTGILSPDQVDGSYTGDPALFIADEGKAAQQGFGSAEPYLYEVELTDCRQSTTSPIPLTATRSSSPQSSPSAATSAGPTPLVRPTSVSAPSRPTACRPTAPMARWAASTSIGSPSSSHWQCRSTPSRVRPPRTASCPTTSSPTSSSIPRSHSDRDRCPEHLKQEDHRRGRRLRPAPSSHLHPGSTATSQMSN